jgi:sulfatase maturation enzyme AslB (radical SAM superfamily)
MSRATLARVVSLVAEAAARNGASRVEFEWSGGEPLLMSAPFYEEAFQLQRERVTADVTNVIYSNLLLLDEGTAELIADASAEVYTSLDDLGSNAMRRGARGDYFTQFDRHLSLLLRRNVRVKLYATVTRDNVHSFAAVYRYAKARGIDFDFSNVQHPFLDAGVRLQELAPEPDDFVREARGIFEDWFQETSAKTSVKPFHAVLEYLVGRRSQPGALLSFDPGGGIYRCPFDISKGLPCDHVDSVPPAQLAVLVESPCQPAVTMWNPCLGCRFNEFCNWMLCREVTGRGGEREVAAFANTCRYWKPIFEHIRERVTAQLAAIGELS